MLRVMHSYITMPVSTARFVRWRQACPFLHVGIACRTGKHILLPHVKHIKQSKKVCYISSLFFGLEPHINYNAILHD
jgi:methionine synthase I (cobalamin-dependent)